MQKIWKKIATSFCGHATIGPPHGTSWANSAQTRRGRGEGYHGEAPGGGIARSIAYIPIFRKQKKFAERRAKALDFSDRVIRRLSIAGSDRGGGAMGRRSDATLDIDSLPNRALRRAKTPSASTRPNRIEPRRIAGEHGRPADRRPGAGARSARVRRGSMGTSFELLLTGNATKNIDV